MQIIGIFSVPRSGSSWLGEVFNSSPDVRFAYQPMFAEKFRDKIHPRTSEKQIREYFKIIYDSQEDFLTQDDSMKKPEYIDFLKNGSKQDFFVFKEVMWLHMIPTFLEQLQDMHIVFIMRNPVDILTSWYNAPREFYPEWDIHKEWRFAQSKMNFLPERYYGYEKWEEAVMLAKVMKERYPERFYIVHYEDLDAEPEENIEKMFRFCNITFTDQTKDFIVETRSSDDGNTYGIHRNSKTTMRDRKKLPDDVLSDIKARLGDFINYMDWDEIETYKLFV